MTKEGVGMKCSYCQQKCYRKSKPMIMLWTGSYIVCEDCFFKSLESKYGKKTSEVNQKDGKKTD